jgi:hypothetical protein
MMKSTINDSEWGMFLAPDGLEGGGGGEADTGGGESRGQAVFDEPRRARRKAVVALKAKAKGQGAQDQCRARRDLLWSMPGRWPSG